VCCTGEGKASVPFLAQGKEAYETGPVSINGRQRSLRISPGGKRAAGGGKERWKHGFREEKLGTLVTRFARSRIDDRASIGEFARRKGRERDRERLLLSAAAGLAIRLVSFTVFGAARDEGAGKSPVIRPVRCSGKRKIDDANHRVGRDAIK
jgi:hypothetical protein